MAAPERVLVHGDVRDFVSQVHASFLIGQLNPDQATLRPGLLDQPERFASSDVVEQWRAAGERVALVGDYAIERPEQDFFGAAQLEWRRTRVVEGLQQLRGSWWALAAAHLSRLSRRRVTISLYESDAADTPSGWHHDMFDGVVVQVAGEKAWRIADQNVTTVSGDVMAIPMGVGHGVSTPVSSRHLLVGYLPQPMFAKAPVPA